MFFRLPSETPPHARPAIVRWLTAILVLLTAMILLGGATRLTDSGLSITEWQVVTGSLPPLSERAWLEEFEKYKQIPEYQQINKGMSLAAFKTIYWWEWSHRLLGRLIGLAFALPFLFFLVRGWVGRHDAIKMLILFVLGGLQGALGWFMVQSGLVDRVDVSQYRLAAHLGLAFVIFGAVSWVRWQVLEEATGHRRAVPRGPMTWFAWALLVLVFVQIIAGAFVAGLDAGHAYNTWPLMDGALVPKGYLFIEPVYLNLFENIATVQFNHRTLAYLIAVSAGAAAWLVWKNTQHTDLRRPSGLLLAAIGTQIVLGIWTLLAVVPTWLGLLHQAGAVVVFLAALYFCYSTVRLGPSS